MSILSWILSGGVLMSLIALSGSLTLLLNEKTLKKILLPLVALAAGSLMGGALFHMLPASVSEIENLLFVFALVATGFCVFMILEQFMHWHHCHRKLAYHKQPVTILILIADSLHNFIDGIVVGSAFLINTWLGVTAWLATAAHEIPQELGDFGVLINGGWNKKKALLVNFLSGLTFLAGSIAVYFASSWFQLNTVYLVAFGAGNFLYIATSDLIPQINKEETAGKNLLHFFAFVTGLVILFLLA
jgi:zinc and cadmium transporter